MVRHLQKSGVVLLLIYIYHTSDTLLPILYNMLADQDNRSRMTLFLDFIIKIIYNNQFVTILDTP